MFLPRLMLGIAGVYSAMAFAHSEAPPSDSSLPYTLTQVFKGPMSDAELKNWDMLAARLDIVPGGVDPSPHRHDADTFVYVLEGAVEVELNGVKTLHRAGEMFHEPRNVTHSLLRNVNQDKPARILALFVVKSPRAFFVPVVVPIENKKPK